MGQPLLSLALASSRHLTGAKEVNLTNSLVWLSSSSPGGGRGLFLLSQLKQLPKDLAVFIVYDGSHFKLPLQGFNLLLKGLWELCHLKPFLHLLEELDQTEANEGRKLEFIDF